MSAKKKTLSQWEFISEVAKSQKTTKVAVHNAINLLKRGATDVLKQQKSFRLFEFASFNIVERKGRQGRNPKTGEKMAISECKIVRMTPSNVVKAAINGTMETKQDNTKMKAKSQKPKAK